MRIPIIKYPRPILDVAFFKDILEAQEKIKDAEKKQKEQELELFAELIAEKVVEKLKELNK